MHAPLNSIKIIQSYSQILISLKFFSTNFGQVYWMTDLFPILIITGKGHQTLNKRLCCRKAQIALKTPLSIGVINNEVYTVLPDWRNQTVIYPKILSVFSHKCIVQNLTNRNPVWIMKKSRVRTDMSRKNNKYTKEKDVYDIIAGTLLYGLILLAFTGGTVVL